MTIPKCIEKRSFQKLVKKIEEDQSEENDPWNWAKYDMTIDRMNAFAERYRTEREGEMRIYEGRKPCYEVRNFMLENKEKESKETNETKGEIETSDV